MWQNPLDLKIPQHYQFSYYQFCFSNKKYHEVISSMCCCKDTCYHVIQEFLAKQNQLYFIRIFTVGKMIFIRYTSIY